MFSHEKMRVYQAAKQFLVWRVEILAPIKRRVSALDHLQRASESIGLNIAHASSAWSKKERMNYIGHANGSALECAAALDVLAVKELVEGEESLKGKEALSQIVGMLVAWHSSTGDRVKEDRGEYLVSIKEPMFKHEQLNVYKSALQLCGWVQRLTEISSCSGDLLRKIDKSTTSIVLNIAEGNGRFHTAEQLSFIQIAIDATAQATALIDMALSSVSARNDEDAEIPNRLTDITRMLHGWHKKMSLAVEADN
jgi:four helix bundle protein